MLSVRLSAQLNLIIGVAPWWHARHLPCLYNSSPEVAAIRTVHLCTVHSEMCPNGAHANGSLWPSAGRSIPLLDSTLPGPFDSPEDSSLEFFKAIQTIQGACAQLCATIANPAHTMVNRAICFEDTVCIQVALDAKISDYLLDRPEGVHVSELSKLSGIEEGKLARILRLLAIRHCYREVEPNVFANNRLSLKLCSDDPVSAMLGHLSNEAFQGASRLYETLSDPEWGHSYSSQKAPFVRVHGVHGFQYYAERPQQSERFNRAMIGWKMAAEGIPLPRLYPWGELPEGATLCDVGGGNGHATLAVVKAFPHIKVVLQDLPHVLQDGKQLWDAEAKDLVEQERVQFVDIDFFKEQPVKGCQVYYMSHILHDWPDADCVAILRNVVSSMGPDSKLLIHEIVLQTTARSKVNGAVHNPNQAPEPLLPNYGVGRVLLYSQDVHMMTTWNGKERTLQEIIDLGSRVGLKFVTMYDGAESGIVEFGL